MKNRFGLANPKIEGAPIHPDELNYEHDLFDCTVCAAKYRAQLFAYEKWEMEYYGTKQQNLP